MWRDHQADRQDAGVAKMSLTSRQPAAQRGGRRPASFADSQLRHLDSVLVHVTCEGVAHSDELDHVYWEQRIRALEDTHELVASQRARTAKLRAMLSVKAQVSAARRTAA
jgi:hypothetical protein